MSIERDHSDAARDQAVVRVIIIEGSVNLLMLITKFAVGLSTGSLAILRDAVHSLTDVANNVLAFFIARVSATPPDDAHPYGHRKFESLAVFVLAGVLAVLALQIIVHAFTRRHQYRTGPDVGCSNRQSLRGIVGAKTRSRVVIRSADGGCEPYADRCEYNRSRYPWLAVIGGRLRDSGSIVRDWRRSTRVLVGL